MTLTPREYAYADDEVTRLLGLPPRQGGYGLLLCTDEHGRHVTRAGDPSITLAIANGMPVESNLAKDFPWSMPGWPDDNLPKNRAARRKKGPRR